MADELGPSGLRAYAVNVEQKTEGVRPFLDGLHVTLPVLNAGRQVVFLVAAPVGTRAGAPVVTRRPVGQDRVRRTDGRPAVAHLRHVTGVGRYTARSARGKK